jgi:hypothetical protein
MEHITNTTYHFDVSVTFNGLSGQKLCLLGSIPELGEWK